MRVCVCVYVCWTEREMGQEITAVKKIKQCKSLEQLGKGS